MAFSLEKKYFITTPPPPLTPPPVTQMPSQPASRLCPRKANTCMRF
jgi:hypothetical protein